MKRRIKESKNIFPCTVYMENQDYDEAYYYLDTPEYGLSWRYFDDVEQEDIENYKYIIKNIADLRKAIDDLEEDFIHGYGNSYFKLSENYMEDLLNRGKTLVCVKKEHKERVYIIRVKPAQNVELALAESFEKTIRNLQKEGLFENVKSFDLNFTGKGINVKLNENTSIMPSAEELDELGTKFYKLVGACENYDYEYRSKYSEIYLVYMDTSGSYRNYHYKDSKDYVGDSTEIENNAINGVSLDDLYAESGRAIIKYTAYSLDDDEEIEKALNGNGKLVGVICEYIAQEADPEGVFMSKLKRNNFIKKFCDKYHLTPIFYIGRRGQAGEKWDENWYDTFTELFNEHYDPIDEYDYYEELTMTGPFGEEYKD